MPVKKDFSVNVGTGAPSLVTIFLILSLISFSVLSYMTSMADYRFANNRMEHSTAYHNASNESEERLAQIKQVLENIYQNSDKQAYFTNVIEALDQYDINSTDNTLTFRTQIRDTQDLQVTIRLEYPDTEFDPLYTIVEWRVIRTGDWEPDNSLNLM